MTLAHDVAYELRRAVGLTEQHVAPDALAAALGLELVPLVGELRAGLYGRSIQYDDAVPLDVQDYQLARFACAYALREMGLIGSLSPHDLALALCVTSAPRPRGRVAYLAERRARQATVVD